ncbi:MAG TPA: lipid II flippase MurJ, partial [Chlamydiales bacterium]|nr:lipid II flippase MurJ [Chlamydiales bacterium]
MKDHPRTLAKSAFSFLSGTLLSRVSGVMRDMSMAFFFGTSASIAAFLVALRFATLLRRLFGEGALLNGFIPHFEEKRRLDPKGAALFFRDVFFSMLFLLLVLIGSGELLLYQWIDASPIVYLVMLILPGVLFVCLFGICSALLHCEKCFFLTGVAPVAYNAIWLSAVWIFRNERPELAAIGLAISISLAFFCQWFMTVPKTASFVFQFLSWKEWVQPRFFSAEIRRMLASLSLAVLGVTAVQLNTAIDTLFARLSSLEGPAYLNYAIHLQQLPLALFGIALSSALLPPLSRAFQAENQALAKQLLESAVSNALLLILPCTAAIFALGRVSVNLLLGRGDFTAVSAL